MVRDVQDRWQVAFSLAGEQRDLVRAVAEAVEQRLGDSTVFYDEWYEHYIAGADADLLLQEIYSSRCELVVLCISGEYGGKPWTQAEHRAVRARFMDAVATPTERTRVLAVRVGEGDVPGILTNEIAPDIRARHPEAAADLIVNRLGLVTPLRPTSATDVGSWPAERPQFLMPIADHTEAQQAFCDLLVATSHHRILLVEGVSETGKSHLARQIERILLEALPELRSSRFDFKGSTGRDLELVGFAQQLGLEVPDGEALGEQLAAVVDRLRASPRPTVLVFDTYEAAGEAKAWVERVLLPQLLRLDWLRVVVLGKSVPARRDALWDSIAAPTITLTLPEPEDWFEFGRRHRPDDDAITLDFVTQVHELSGGKPATLASLLGPR